DRGDAEEFYRIRRIADRGLPGLLCAAVDGGPRGRGYRNAGGDRAAEIRHCADSGAGGDGDDRVESKPEATHDRSERHEIPDGRLRRSAGSRDHVARGLRSAGRVRERSRTPDWPGGETNAGDRSAIVAG